MLDDWSAVGYEQGKPSSIPNDELIDACRRLNNMIDVRSSQGHCFYFIDPPF